jgi:hypothetical protein
MSIKSRLARLEQSEPPPEPFLGSQRWWVYLVGELAYEDQSATEREELAVERQKRERDHDPPDSVERFLAREIARMEGEPDPYGTDGLSDAERRAWDWADYREQERQRIAEQSQEEDNSLFYRPL